MWSALGIAAALLERERTGAGATVDTSLYEAALAYVGYHLVGYLSDGTVPRPEGSVFPMVAPYQVLPTGDGELMVAAGNDRLFAALCGALGLPGRGRPALPHEPGPRRAPDRPRRAPGGAPAHPPERTGWAPTSSRRAAASPVATSPTS